MKRIAITERPDWREKATEFGFRFHTMYGEPYWCEDAYYQFTLAQIEEIENATAELHQMCLQVVEKVVGSDELMAKFCIPKHTWEFVRSSWRTNQPSLYSRLDLAYDGVNPPKLLENNADTPTSLYEAAIFQWLWLEDQINAGKLDPESDQYNSLQEKLIERFAELKAHHGFGLLHLACCQDSEEDRGTVQYLQDCAQEAGLPTEFLFMEEIGLGEKGQFTDLQDQVIGNLFKLYPWAACAARMKKVPNSGPLAPPTLDSSVIPVFFRIKPISLSATDGSFSTTLLKPRFMFRPWSASPISVSSWVRKSRSRLNTSPQRISQSTTCCLVNAIIPPQQPQRSAGVFTGASHKDNSSSSTFNNVMDTPCISSEVQ